MSKSIKHKKQNINMPNVYAALLEQSGATPPVLSVLENGLDDTISSDYNDVGQFILYYTNEGLFDPAKTFVSRGALNSNCVGSVELLMNVTPAGLIEIKLVDGDVFFNGTGGSIPIKIEVYS